MTTNIPTDLRRAFEDKIRRGIFRPIERHLHEAIREERMQEALGLTWRLYADHARRGEILDDALLVHACRLRAIDLGRQVVQCDGQPKRDVFDSRNYLSGRVEVLRFGDFADQDEHRDPSEDEVPLGFGFAEATTTNPTRRILSAIDLTTWLADLPAEDRQMLTLRAAGCTLEETADELGVSISSVFANCKRLGLALAERAGVWLVPKKKRKACASSRPMAKAKSSRTHGRPGMKKAGTRSAGRPSSSPSKEVAVAA